MQEPHHSRIGCYRTLAARGTHRLRECPRVPVRNKLGPQNNAAPQTSIIYDIKQLRNAKQQLNCKRVGTFQRVRHFVESVKRHTITSQCKKYVTPVSDTVAVQPVQLLVPLQLLLYSRNVRNSVNSVALRNSLLLYQ